MQKSGAEPSTNSLNIEEVLVLEDPDSEHYTRAAGFLEKSMQAGNKDPQVFYLLAQVYRKQGKIDQARTTLRGIKPPNAYIFNQLALLSLNEKKWEQAHAELDQSLQLDPDCFTTYYNLILTNLSLGNLEVSLERIPRAIELAKKAFTPTEFWNSHPELVEFLENLEALLRAAVPKFDGSIPASLAQLTPRNEQRLLTLIRSLGNIESVLKLIEALLEARPHSGPIREAHVESLLIKAKNHVDRCQWHEAERILKPLSGDRSTSRSTQVALLNLLGCCSVMTQEIETALDHFQSCIKVNPGDHRLVQNMALTYEILGDQSQAEPFWNLFFNYLENKIVSTGSVSEYWTNLAHEGLIRLANRLSEKEKWSQALSYVLRASRLKPNCPETMERLFHLYNHNKQFAEARRTLERLRRLRPGDPQLDLYELDLAEMKNLGDIDRMLGDIDAIIKRYPGDPRVEERAVTMVGNVIPLMSNLCEELNNQISKVIDQVRVLPDYQINWPAVREVMRERLKEFQKLRKITSKCLPLISNEEHRRMIHDLGEHIDKKMEVCRSLGT